MENVVCILCIYEYVHIFIFFQFILAHIKKPILSITNRTYHYCSYLSFCNLFFYKENMYIPVLLFPTDKTLVKCQKLKFDFPFLDGIELMAERERVGGGQGWIPGRGR